MPNLSKLHGIIYFGKPDYSVDWVGKLCRKNNVELITRQYLSDKTLIDEVLAVNDIVKNIWDAPNIFYHNYDHAIDVFMAMVLILHISRISDEYVIAKMLICALIHDYKHSYYSPHMTTEELTMKSILNDGLSYKWYRECYDIVISTTIERFTSGKNNSKNDLNLMKKLLAADVFNSCVVSYNNTMIKSLKLKTELKANKPEIDFNADSVLEFLNSCSKLINFSGYYDRFRSIYYEIKNDKDRANNFLNGLSMTP